MSAVPGGERAEADGHPVDFAFLRAQCFNDEALQRELLALFLRHTVASAARLRGLGAREQDEAAHLLQGACQGVGARRAAEAARGLAAASQPEREQALAHLLAAVAEAEAAIRARLATPFAPR